jgi:large subunit ribosomal protein L27e
MTHNYSVTRVALLRLVCVKLHGGRECAVRGARRQLLRPLPDLSFSMKKGRVVILTAGRMAGKKAVIVKQNDEGRKDKKFAHALCVGVERPPRRVIKSMSKKKIDRKCRLKPFVKFVNYNHMMPTRFVMKEDLDFKTVVTDERMAKPETRKAMKAELKTMLQQRYVKPEAPGEKQAAADFLFKKLRF